MKKAALTTMASLVVTMAVNATLPVGTTIRTEGPQVTVVPLQNGVVKTVQHISGLDAGTWMAWGSCTMQTQVRAGVRGDYLYSFTSISAVPDQLPNELGLQYLDARPYNTGYMDAQGQWHPTLYWWFGANPPPRVFHFTGDPTLYLVALSQGQVAPASAQIFCTMIAEKTAL